MNSRSLKKWCKARRGRAAALADKLGKSREFVRQMQIGGGDGGRPIPPDMHELIPAAMQSVEAEEQSRLKEAMHRIEKT